MFRFTMRPSSGSHSQYFAKITQSVQCEYMEVVQALSMLWLRSIVRAMCAVHCASVYAHTVQSTHASHYTMQPVRPPCIHIEPSV